MASLDRLGFHRVDATQGGTVTIFLTVLLSIAFYNAVELTILIFVTFHRYDGLYFWSILLSTVLGIIPSTAGTLLNYFSIGPLWLAISFSTIGFYFTVPGQLVVLYSRLNLVLHNTRILRFILFIIIIDAVIILPATIVLTFGSAYIQEHHWNFGYYVIERLEVTWFCVQEFLMSLVYIWEIIRLLNLDPEKHSRRSRVIYELMALNLIIIVMDIALLVAEYRGHLFFQVVLKCFVYSVKLKLEFAVLGRLVNITTRNHHEPTTNELFNIPDSMQFQLREDFETHDGWMR
ncbi:hypothetical protein N7453_010633 [Penicillium expansum]|nr:hypothetical protein N7453_010633 [Penicillium expansum]